MVIIILKNTVEKKIASLKLNLTLTHYNFGYKTGDTIVPNQSIFFGIKKYC